MIVTLQMPYVRSISMGVWVNVGARDENPAESGLSHFIEHMIFKGTRQRSAYQIAKEFDAIGGQTNAFTTMENTCYHAKVIDTHLDTMVDILSDIFLNSRFDETEVEKERPVILQEIGMVEDNKGSRAMWGMSRTIVANLVTGFFGGMGGATTSRRPRGGRYRGCAGSGCIRAGAGSARSPPAGRVLAVDAGRAGGRRPRSA